MEAYEILGAPKKQQDRLENKNKRGALSSAPPTLIENLFLAD